MDHRGFGAAHRVVGAAGFRRAAAVVVSGDSRADRSGPGLVDGANLDPTALPFFLGAHLLGGGGFSSLRIGALPLGDPGVRGPAGIDPRAGLWRDLFPGAQ